MDQSENGDGFAAVECNCARANHTGTVAEWCRSLPGEPHDN